MEIRKAVLSDTSVIVSLSAQLGYPTVEEQLHARLWEILQKADHTVWVAELENGTVVGWVHVMRTLVPEIDPFAEIGGLVVDSELRSQGIGKALLDRAENWARENHLTSLCVRSNVIRTRAHQFYQQAGYTIIKSQHVFEKKLD